MSNATISKNTIIRINNNATRKHINSHSALPYFQDLWMPRLNDCNVGDAWRLWTLFRPATSPAFSSNALHGIHESRTHANFTDDNIQSVDQYHQHFHWRRHLITRAVHGPTLFQRPTTLSTAVENLIICPLESSSRKTGMIMLNIRLSRIYTVSYRKYKRILGP